MGRIPRNYSQNGSLESPDLQTPRLLVTVVAPWIYCVPVHLDPQTLDASPQMSPVVLCGPDASIRHPPSHHTTPHSKGLLMAGST